MSLTVDEVERTHKLLDYLDKRKRDVDVNECPRCGLPKKFLLWFD